MSRSNILHKKLMGITYLSMLVTNGIVVLVLPWILKAYHLSEVTSGYDNTDCNILCGMQHFNLAVVLYDAGHVPGGRRRKDVYDYIGGLYVDFPYRLQLYSGALYGMRYSSG